MRKKLMFSLLALLFALGFNAVSAPAATNRSCTISCDTDPSISCTSEVGDCRIVYGGYNKLYCDGIEYRCIGL